MKLIGVREKNKELQKLFDTGKQVYSYSKLSTIENCLYGAYKTYIKHEKGQGNIYSFLGGQMHDVLEGIMNGENTERDLLPAMCKELEDLDMLDISFPKSRDGSDGIRDGWVANMTHFCNNFKKPEGNFTTEDFIILKVDEDHYIQGYVDLIKMVDEKNKVVKIYDWKTSSQFGKEDLIHHGRQLVIYQMAYEQQGYTVDEVAWIMLKYCVIKYMGKKRINSKKDTLIEKVVERKKIVSELAKDIEFRLMQLGYSELDIECMLHEAIINNSLENLPDEVKSRYKISPYVRVYEVTEELKEECLNYINKTSSLWEGLNEEESKYPPRKFTKMSKSGKVSDDVFFCLNLCNHKDNCPHVKKHLDTKQNTSEYDDLF